VSEGEGLEGGNHAALHGGKILGRTLALKKKLRAGGVAIGAWLAFTDPAGTEILGRTGFDFLIVDTEHGGAWDLQQVQGMLMALNGTDTVPIVRVPWNDPVRIKLMLDLGVEGILAPMVSTVAECRDLVAACRYPPHGRRGIGPRRASNYYRNVQDYVAVANEAIFVIPQIENIATIDILDEFLAVPGIDAVAIGPNDMAGTAGVFGNRKHPRIEAAVERICAAAKARGIPVFLGINTTPAEQRAWIEEGVRILTVTSDTELVVGGARDALKATRDVLAL
jgi:2-keto-3-deoxy-L-rhamnonate aldolase RhmA